MTTTTLKPLVMNDNERAAKSRKWKNRYPFRYKAPFEGWPKGIDATFMWIPFREKGYALFLFADEEDRDAFAARHEKAAA